LIATPRDITTKIRGLVSGLMIPLLVAKLPSQISPVALSFANSLTVAGAASDL